MAMFPSMSVTPECVNLCKVSTKKGENRVRSWYQCSVLSCAWKAPRVLTGSFASTTRPYHTDGIYRWQRRSWLRDGNHSAWRAEDASKRKSNLSAKSKLSISKKICGYESSLIVDMTWALSCSFSNPDSSDDMDPESLWESLKPSISYLVPDELNLVHDALKLAFDAHSGQKRRSGEPFIIHPVEVARILGELELDWESIAAGLLHDTVEDTHVVTFDRIEKEFGKTVRNIVEGETKVSKLGKIQCTGKSNSKQDVKADDLRQMFLAMTDEVRVIIVKLADRLHNMRTLSHMPQHKQSAIARETLEVFAPLAKLLGMYEIKSELECLSFMYTNPSEYSELNKRVKEYSRVHEKELEEAKRVLKKKIEEDKYLKSVTAETEVRPSYKELYSIYKSMCQSKSSMNEINEMAQLRIIIKPKTREDLEPLCSAQQVCYHVLGIVHGIWTPVPQAVKDYIATPKPNNYQSLHTTVIPFLKESMFRLEVQSGSGDKSFHLMKSFKCCNCTASVRVKLKVPTKILKVPTGILQFNLQADGDALMCERVERVVLETGAVRDTVIRIRTEEMDLIAERGIAAHYRGGDTKQGKAIHLNNTSIALRIGWLNAIREWQQEFVGNMSSREFVDTVTGDLLGSRVFVFTPKGEMKNLPKGATAIDYAYLIHTEIGNKMVMAKVNGNHVYPTHVLSNAEVVEIITSDASTSESAFKQHMEWLQHAKTRCARHKILKFLNEHDRDKNFIKDEEICNQKISNTPNHERKSIWEKILSTEEEFLFPKIKKDLLHVKNGTNSIEKKCKVDSIKLNGTASFKRDWSNSISTYKEVPPGLDIWKAKKITIWHTVNGNSIQWLCVICIDRERMMSDVTSALAANGITISSCVSEIDKRQGVGAMLFHFEGSYENLVSACMNIDSVNGVCSWSIGCSLTTPLDDDHWCL